MIIVIIIRFGAPAVRLPAPGGAVKSGCGWGSGLNSLCPPFPWKWYCQTPAPGPLW